MKHWKRIIAVFALCMLSVGLISAQPALASNDRHEELLWEELLWKLVGGAGTKEPDESDQSDQPNQPDTEKTGWVSENGLWHYYEDEEVHSVANMLLSFPYERDNGGSAIGENRPEPRIIGIGIPEYNTDDGAIIPDTLSSDSGPDVLPAGSALIVSTDSNGVISLTQSEFNLILEDLGYDTTNGYYMTPEGISALFTNITPYGLELLQQRINQFVSERSKDPDAAPVKGDLDAIFLNGENGSVLLANTPMNLVITDNAKVDAVFLAAGAADSTVTVRAGSSVDAMKIGAARNTVHVEAGASVGGLVLDAPDATVTADGTVQNVTLTGNSTDAKLDGAGIQQQIINADALKAGKTAVTTLIGGQRAVIPIKCGKNASVTVNVTITPPTAAAGTPVIEGLDGAFASAGNGQYTASLEDVAFRKFKVVIVAKEDMSFSISMTGIEADGEETDDSANQQEDGNAAASGENTAQSSGHTHVWGNWKQTKAPTCTEKGAKTRACQVEGCGTTQTWLVDVIAHDWDTSAWITDGSKHWHKCKTPGCTAITDEAAHSGGTATCQAKAKCAVCGEEYGTLGEHDWDTSAWITDGSKHWHKCKTEGCTAITDEAAHSGGTATCQAKAVCAVCNQLYGEVADHDWDTSAWITDGSKHWHKCKTPGCTAITDEAAHSGGTATCKEKAVCDVCKQLYGEFGEHKMEIVIPAVEPTCEFPGITALYRCSVCKEAVIPREEYGEPLNHEVSFTLVSQTPATCVSPGLTLSKCDACGKEIREETPIDPNAHNLLAELIPGKAATCTETGLTNGERCPDCKAILTAQKEIPALTHDWGEWKQTKAPTCLEASDETRTCKRDGCGATETRPVDVIAHDWDTSAWITDGSKHWHKCKTPGCTAITDEAAHSGGTATCKEKAVCDVCKQPYGEFGEHKMEIVEPAVEPTCESPGMTAYYRCSVCEEAEIPSEEYGEPLNHDWAETLTQGDTTHYYACSRCEARKDEAPHSGGTATCQAKAKCAVCGKEYGELADHDWETSGWITDGSKHWHKCKTEGCTAITDEAAHSGGTATCQAKAKCEVCGEDYGEKSTENHAGGTKKVYYTEGDTGYEYYVVCLSCGEKTGETGVTPYDDETFDSSTVEWDYGEILVPGS